MRQLVLGSKGQVGSAILEVLKSKSPYVMGLDIGTPKPVGRFGALHCCIPYTGFLITAVVQYVKEYLLPGGLLIIHSTVPVGTTKKIGGLAPTASVIHSPVRGVHPHLAEGIRTLPKYFGGLAASRGARIFKPFCETIITLKAETTEALKLWDTTYYGWCIVFEKAVKAYCEHNGLDFDVVYTNANQTYNKGYFDLDRTDVQRPVLQHMDGPIGGHCVLPNAELLGGAIADFILKYKG